MFDAMGALSSQYNDTPEKASRSFDQNRDGFVIAGGSGMLILEEEEHAIKRNAPILARCLFGLGFWLVFKYVFRKICMRR